MHDVVSIVLDVAVVALQLLAIRGALRVERENKKLRKKLKRSEEVRLALLDKNPTDDKTDE